jgi:hypothetical protein
VRDLLAGSTAGADRNLWLVTPDTWPRGLPVVWLVMGKTPDHPGSITIPIEADRITAVVNALSRRHPVAERCDTCRLWRRLTEDSGECHALAPHPVLYDPLMPPSAGGWLVAWPTTGPGDYCGEWSPLPVRPQDGGPTP